MDFDIDYALKLGKAIAEFVITLIGALSIFFTLTRNKSDDKALPKLERVKKFLSVLVSKR